VENHAVRVRFGEFVFDEDARVLSRAGQRVSISPKAFQLLRALLSRRPNAVTRAELNDLLWPGTAMGYTSLASVVTELRRLLDDDSRDFRYIRTIHGFGYAFCSEATDEPVHATRASFACALVIDGREIPLTEGENVIGRDEGCAVRIDASKVSRRHARIIVQGLTARIEDLGSKNGTFLQSRRLEGAADLVEGDEIVIGGTRFTYRAAYGSGSTATE
jgi:DNA-binding winged helix-turn-helix (wHTH) protein